MSVFERPEITELLLKRIDGFRSGYRQNLALLGPRGVGKSALLKRLLEQKAWRETGWVPVYLPLEWEDSLTEWACRFVRTFLYSLLQGRQVVSLPAQLPELFRVACEVVPGTVASAQRLLEGAEGGRPEELYDRIWDLPQRVAQETGCLTLLVVDEFHRLRSLPVRDPFLRLGRKIMVHGSTMYLLSSSQVAVARSILREGLSLLFGQFEIVEMPPLSAPASLKAVRALLPPGSSDSFLEYALVELAQGSAAHLDLLLKGWMQLSAQPVPEEGDRLVLLLESMLFSPQGALRRRFEAALRCLPKHRSRLGWIQVLEVVAQGIHRVRRLAQGMQRPVAQVVSALKVLEQAGLVVKEGVFYRMPDRLFRLWMLTAYPVLQGLWLIDPVQAAAQFRKATQAWIAALREAFGQSVEARCLALLREWGGERVEIEGRQMFLPRWKQLDRVQRDPPAEFSGGVASVWWVAQPASGRSRRWCVVPWTGPLSEVQARRWLEDFQLGGELKRQRVVLVGAYPVEVLARLLLQQAGVRLWDLTVLNRLLDLYGLAPLPVPAEEERSLGYPVTVPLPLEERTGGSAFPLPSSWGLASE